MAFSSLRACGVPDSAADLICDLGQVITRSGFRKGPQFRRPDFRGSISLSFQAFAATREFQCEKWVPQIRLKVSDPKPFKPSKLTLTLWDLCSNAFGYSQWMYDWGGVLRTVHEQYKYENCISCCAFLYYRNEYKLTCGGEKATLNQKNSALTCQREGCPFWTEVARVLLQLCSRRTIPAGYLVHITGCGILLRHFELGVWLPGGWFLWETGQPAWNESDPKLWSLWTEEESLGNLSSCLRDSATWEGCTENIAHEWWRCWNIMASSLSWDTHC